MTNSPNNIALRPCPFCGCAMAIESNRDWHRIVGDHDEECMFVERETCMVPATDDQLQAAQKDWNRRAQPGTGSLDVTYEHRDNKERHTVTVSRAEVIEHMAELLFVKLTEKFCQCEPIGETNVVECLCDQYTEEFEVVPDASVMSTTAGSKQVQPRETPSRTIKLSGCEFTEDALLRRAVRAVRGNRRNTLQRWALVRDAFGCGSGVATALCRRFGFDPEEILK